MKKILAFLLATLLVVSLLAACGKKNNTDATQPTGEESSAEGATGENGATEEATTPTEGGETTQPTDSNIEVGIDTEDDTEDSTEGGVIDFDDLLDAAN